MFGLGKKDRDGRQVRLDHRGKNTRLSRTGTPAIRAQGKVGPVTATVNSNHGLRLSGRVAKGLRVASQQGRMQVIGRWHSGPFAFNLSKSSMSASVKTSTGRLNLFKPGYSSFKAGGIHVRGKKAAQLQVIVMMISGVLWLCVAALVLAWMVFWFALVVLAGLYAVLAGFVRGLLEKPESVPNNGDDPLLMEGLEDGGPAACLRPIEKDPRIETLRK